MLLVEASILGMRFSIFVFFISENSNKSVNMTKGWILNVEYSIQSFPTDIEKQICGKKQQYHFAFKTKGVSKCMGAVAEGI